MCILYIGINGCSLRTEANLEIIKQIPEHLLLIETDAPWCGIKPTHASYKYIHPTSHFTTKKLEKYESNYMVKDRNEPCTLIQVLQVLSAVRGRDIRVLSEVIYNNTQRLLFSNSV